MGVELPVEAGGGWDRDGLPVIFSEPVLFVLQACGVWRLLPFRSLRSCMVSTPGRMCFSSTFPSPISSPT